MARLSIAFSLLVALLGCAGRYVGDENSPFYAPPAGTTVTLNQTITIPGERTAVYLQGGEVRTFNDVGKYYPHCKFELRTRAPSAREVQPETFMVERVNRETAVSWSAIAGPQVAAAGIGIVFGAGSEGDGGSPETYATHLYLRSSRQPDVYRLTCQQWGYPPQGEHVSINDMRRALGPIFTLSTTPAPGVIP
jgi:hypothetical protein